MRKTMCRALSLLLVVAALAAWFAVPAAAEQPVEEWARPRVSSQVTVDGATGTPVTITAAQAENGVSVTDSFQVSIESFNGIEIFIEIFNGGGYEYPVIARIENVNDSSDVVSTYEGTISIDADGNGTVDFGTVTGMQPGNTYVVIYYKVTLDFGGITLNVSHISPSDENQQILVEEAEPEPEPSPSEEPEPEPSPSEEPEPSPSEEPEPSPSPSPSEEPSPSPKPSVEPSPSPVPSPSPKSTPAPSVKPSPGKTTTTTPGSPKTGDSSNLAVWIVVLAVAAAAVVALLALRRRKKQN